jgi:hypothetical protein
MESPQRSEDLQWKAGLSEVNSSGVPFQNISNFIYMLLIWKAMSLLLFCASPAIRFTTAAPPCPLLSGLFNGVQCREPVTAYSINTTTILSYINIFSPFRHCELAKQSLLYGRYEPHILLRSSQQRYV